MNDVDRWILSRLAGLVAVSNKNFESYEFQIITTSLRQFWVQNFCDVYLVRFTILLSILIIKYLGVTLKKIVIVVLNLI